MFYVQTEEEREHYTLVEELMDHEDSRENEFWKLKCLNRKILRAYHSMSKYQGQMNGNAEHAYQKLGTYCNTMYGIDYMDECDLYFLWMSQ